MLTMSGFQQYTLLTADPVSLWKCHGCGAAVADTDQHDYYHGKTRSKA